MPIVIVALVAALPTSVDATTTICGNGTGNCIRVAAADVNISGFTVSNGNRGIYVLNAGNCVITDCIASDSHQDGIKLDNSPGSEIRDCDVTGTSSVSDGYGVHLWESTGALLENLRIFGNPCERPLNVYWSSGTTARNVELFDNAGYSFFGFANYTVEGLSIHNTDHGLLLNDASGCIVRECVISSVTGEGPAPRTTWSRTTSSRSAGPASPSGLQAL